MTNQELMTLRRLLQKSSETLDQSNKYKRVATKINELSGFFYIRAICDTLREGEKEDKSK